MTEKTAKELLLNEVVAHFVADGLGDLSLRKIAAALGTSHRMLLYHFGSKNRLLVEVVREVEARTRAQFSSMDSAFGPDTDKVVRDMWRYVADPARGDFERLFFALYGRALQGDAQLRPLLGEAIDSWLDAQTVAATAQGIPADLARAHGRLGLAVTRGLLLDLLATGDRTGVDAALDIFARNYVGRWWERQPSAMSAPAS